MNGPTLECRISPDRQHDSSCPLTTLRVGAVSYLNSKPLIEGLEQELNHDQLILDVPSRLADDLNAGDLDVALIPSVEYFHTLIMKLFPTPVWRLGDLF